MSEYEEHEIDGHMATITIAPYSKTAMGICECGVTAVSSTSKRVVQYIHRKHKKKGIPNGQVDG